MRRQTTCRSIVCRIPSFPLSIAIAIATPIRPCSCSCARLGIHIRLNRRGIRDHVQERRRIRTWQRQVLEPRSAHHGRITRGKSRSRPRGETRPERARIETPFTFSRRMAIRSFLTLRPGEHGGRQWARTEGLIGEPRKLHRVGSGGTRQTGQGRQSEWFRRCRVAPSGRGIATIFVPPIALAREFPLAFAPGRYTTRLFPFVAFQTDRRGFVAPFDIAL